MRSPEIIESDLKTNTDKLLDFLNICNDLQISTNPASGGWSIKECFEHLYIIENRIALCFQEDIKENNRDPEHKITMIRDVLNNMERKYQAPDNILPTGTIDDMAVAKSEFSQNRDSLIEKGNQTDWTDACMGLKHWGFGILTKIEWVYLCIYHAERHLRQMQNALQKSNM